MQKLASGDHMVSAFAAVVAASGTKSRLDLDIYYIVP